MHWKRKWQPTPVFFWPFHTILAGEEGGDRDGMVGAESKAPVLWLPDAKSQKLEESNDMVR